MTTFPLRLSDDLKEAAAAQASKAGVSLNHFIASAVAARLGAQAEAQRYFQARAARVKPGEAEAVLRKVKQRKPRADDRIK